MQPSWTKLKFQSLPIEQQHKKASELLRQIHHGKLELITTYQLLCDWMGMHHLTSFDFENLSNRFHYHLSRASVHWQEHNLLSIKTGDKQSSTPFLQVAIYLDNLRSAFNVGSIIRTTEAFRLGSIFFSPSTPFIDNPKVQKASMGTHELVPCQTISDLSSLPKPFIALETAENATDITNFTFPPSFTLLLGNEEYGLSSNTLKLSDHIIKIPLTGYKNSLNVASAFAITASLVRSQIRI